jgi:hypothetical protein
MPTWYKGDSEVEAEYLDEGLHNMAQPSIAFSE